MKHYILMRNFGGMGNRMFRYMLAKRISDETGGWPIVGHWLPEWGMDDAATQPPVGRGIATGRQHQVDVPALVRSAIAEQLDYIEVDSFAMRVEYFAGRRAQFAHSFPASTATPIADTELAINIRTGDILEGFHPDYTPLPLAFYHALIAETGLRPVFVGQLEDNWYCQALRAQFPNARFLSGGAVADFQAMRSARHLVLAVSSFSWLAAYLSDRAQTIHMPLAGLFHPQQRPDIDLMPHDDPRFCYYIFAPDRYLATTLQKDVLVSRHGRPAQGPSETSYLGYQAR